MPPNGSSKSLLLQPTSAWKISRQTKLAWKRSTWPRMAVSAQNDVLIRREAQDVARLEAVVGFVDLAASFTGFDEEEGELVGAGQAMAAGVEGERLDVRGFVSAAGVEVGSRRAQGLVPLGRHGGHLGRLSGTTADPDWESRMAGGLLAS